MKKQTNADPATELTADELAASQTPTSIVKAMRFVEQNFKELVDWIGEENIGDGTSEDEGVITIRTLEGDFDARVGDWIVKGIGGKFYSCKPDIFRD
jgi:hypothetical protein